MARTHVYAMQMSGRCRSLSELDRRIATYMWAFALFNVSSSRHD